VRSRAIKKNKREGRGDAKRKGLAYSYKNKRKNNLTTIFFKLNLRLRFLFRPENPKKDGAPPALF
jgi:hypothetical protein